MSTKLHFLSSSFFSFFFARKDTETYTLTLGQADAAKTNTCFTPHSM